MDFKIDENLPIEVARLFAEAGHSGSTSMEEGQVAVQIRQSLKNVKLKASYL